MIGEATFDNKALFIKITHVFMILTCRHKRCFRTVQCQDARISPAIQFDEYSFFRDQYPMSMYIASAETLVVVLSLIYDVGRVNLQSKNVISYFRYLTTRSSPNRLN